MTKARQTIRQIIKSLDTRDDKSSEKFKKEFEKFESRVPFLLLKAFRKQGVFKNAGEKRRAEELGETLEILPKYRALWSAMLDILAQADLIKLEEREKITVLDKGDKEEPPDMEEMKKTFPSLKAHLKLLSTCLDSCFAMLRGETSYVDVLFPKGSFELMEGISRGNPSADICNSLYADLLESYLEKRLREDRSGKLRILEVGSGETSRAIPERIKNHQNNIAYCRSDASPGFAQYLREEFQNDYPFVEDKVLDIERDPESQGIESGSFDLIIGVNAIHSELIVADTLANLKKTLKPDGVLLLSETTGRSDFLTLTFGFADGRRLFEDAKSGIGRSPLLTPEQWRQTLREGGFLNSRVLRIDGEKESGFGQRIILGENNGSVLAKPRSAIGLSTIELEEKTVAYLKSVFSGVVKIDEKKIKTKETFESYGVDSAMVMKITAKLRKDFDDLSATLLFENPTLEELGAYFISRHNSELKNLLALPESAPEEALVEPSQEEFEKKEASGDEAVLSRGAIKTGAPEAALSSDDIAVIGLGGRYPKADDIDEFWNNLKESRDCVSEIPADRWDWRERYDSDKNKKGFSYSKWGGFLKEINKFDPLFFNIPGSEQLVLSPHDPDENPGSRSA